jgi:hypothetical protein
LPISGAFIVSMRARAIGPVAPGLAVARQPAVGVDADQAVSGDVLDRNDLDAGDLDAVQVGCRRQRPVAAEQAGARQRYGQAKQLAARRSSRGTDILHG